MSWKWTKLTLKDEPSPMQNVEFRRQKQFNWNALRSWSLDLFKGFTDYSDSLDAKMTDFDNRFDDQMSAATDGDKDLSEVVDARRPTGGDAYQTLGKRLDSQDETIELSDPTSSKTVLAYLNNESIEVGSRRPDYYQQRLADMAGQIASSTFNFALITDNHYQADTYAPGSISHYANIAALSRVAPIDVIVAGGDNINGDYARDRTLVETRQATSTLYYRSAFDSDVFFAFGNHDTGAFQGSSGIDKTKPSECISIDEIKDFYCAKNPLFDEVRNDDSLYFYKDYADKKVRLIVLNSFDLPEDVNADGTYKFNFLTQSAFRQDQLLWLATKALILPGAGWQVMIYSHAPLSGSFTTIEQYNTEALVNILNAFQAGTAVTVASQELFPVMLSADFSSQGPGTIIAFVSGHLHADGQMVYSGINCIETQASLCAKTNPTRQAGTQTEDAWDCFSVDTSKRQITVLRFGAGKDRLITY